MNIEQRNRILTAIHRADAQNILPGNGTESGQTYSYYFLFDRGGITVVRLVFGTADQIDQCYTLPWGEIRDFRIKNGMLTSQMTFQNQGRKYSFMLSKSVVGNPWVKENRKHLQEVNYYYSQETAAGADVGSAADMQMNEGNDHDMETVYSGENETDLHGTERMTESDPAACLAGMRRLYWEHPITERKLRKPLWLGQRDLLIQVFQDADLLYASGRIYYGCLVQANSRLFDRNDHGDYPASIIYSTDEYFSEHPYELQNIAEMLYSTRNAQRETLSYSMQKFADILNAETDRSQVEFSVFAGGTDHSVRLCSILVFRNDLPQECLQGDIYPVFAMPERSNAVMIVPKEYWTETFIQAREQWENQENPEGMPEE